MERCEWILCLYVLVVQLLRLAGRVGRDSGGKRNLRVGAGMDLLMWSWPALCIYHSTGEWSMKISKWVVWDVEASSWHGKLMRSKSNYMPDAWYSIYFARKKSVQDSVRMMSLNFLFSSEEVGYLQGSWRIIIEFYSKFDNGSCQVTMKQSINFY